MQTLLDDKQCLHFAREEVPSPAEWAGVNVRQEDDKKGKRTTDCVDKDQLRGMSICA
jgi:hypothetical protein